jgi:ATP-dependent HslUV protease subunit HslV
MNTFHATTILAVLHNGKLALGGDGQVTLSNTIVKHNAVKVRKLRGGQQGSGQQGGEVLAGFAGSAADAFTLFERFDAKLDQHNGQLSRAAVEIAKDWRSDRVLRKLDALMIVGNTEHLFLLSGGGDIIQPDDGVLGIGSGGTFALAAAKSLLRTKQSADFSAREIVEIGLQIASEICPFTNNKILIEEIGKT